MELELWQIVILIITGAIVGVSMSFIGQTGSGVVIPVVFLITNDILLAIAINILNDTIAASIVSINYIKNKNYKIRKDNFILIIVSILVSILSVYILITTDLSKAYGIILPVFFIILGIGIYRKGFPTTDSVKQIIHNITERFFKGKKTQQELDDLEKNLDEQLLLGDEVFQGIIPTNSRLFYILAICLGAFLGLNAGLFGASGGFIIVIVLVILYGYPLKKAIGAGLLLSILICLSTFIIFQILGFYFKSRFYFDWTISFYLAIGAIIMGLIMSKYVQRLSAKAMGMGMGATMIILGVFTLIIFFM